MTDILKLDVNDEKLSNIINNNPFYIDIKGSVNICLIRCGQDIESCNDINFSSMTNYGKILVLNPNTNNKSKCNIKLAFDTSNDNINDNGSGNYNFVKAFVTVPSLHRLNGQIYDMETFLVFSSVQKNGNTLYVVLCTLNSGTSMVQSNDWKLLNYKLLDELFIKNNQVPDIHGTNSISGIPNPVDINNFIPPEGLRSFYDYTNPNNSIVNVRVFQNPMAISNEALNMLKSKLTPGTIYDNFKSFITKSTNPLENLFFYYSKDLTDDYKSYKVNDKQKEEKESFEDINNKAKSNTSLNNNNTSLNNNNTSLNNNTSTNTSTNTINDNKNINKNNILDSNTKSNIDIKLDINETEEEREQEQTKEKFDSETNEADATQQISNYGMTLVIAFTCALFFYCIINTKVFILNLFTPDNGLSEEKLSNSISEITNPIISSILSVRLGLNSNLVLQGIIVFLILICGIFYIINVFDKNTLYNTIIGLLSALLVIFINYKRLTLKYYSGKIMMLYDDDYNQKENYFYNYITNKIFKSNNLKDIIFYGFLSFFNGTFRTPLNFEKFLNSTILNSQVGGDGITSVVPGNVSDNQNTKANADYKQKIMEKYDGSSGLNIFGKDFIQNNLEYITEKFNNNSNWKNNLLYSSFFNIFILIALSVLLSYIPNQSSAVIGLFITILVIIGIGILIIAIFYICMLFNTASKSNGGNKMLESMISTLSTSPQPVPIEYGNKDQITIPSGSVTESVPVQPLLSSDNSDKNTLILKYLDEINSLKDEIELLKKTSISNDLDNFSIPSLTQQNKDTSILKYLDEISSLREQIKLLESKSVNTNKNSDIKKALTELLAGSGITPTENYINTVKRLLNNKSTANETIQMLKRNTTLKDEKFKSILNDILNKLKNLKVRTEGLNTKI